jgi:hypothetical protein
MRKNASATNGSGTRVIGIQHRVKATAKGAAHPTRVAIDEGGKVRVLELDTEQNEMDFLHGKFPAKFREAEEGEDLGQFLPHHVVIRGKDGKTKTMVPAAYEGLRNGDTVAMVLGGSGDNFAFALARRGEKIGAEVYRIPAAALKANRVHLEAETENDKKFDAKLLATLAQPGTATRELFYKFLTRDAQLIEVREAVRARHEIMKD